jgi:hypothetical protein
MIFQAHSQLPFTLRKILVPHFVVRNNTYSTIIVFFNDQGGISDVTISGSSSRRAGGGSERLASGDRGTASVSYQP